MAVDYLSALNSKGSGLNITQLVDTLTAAEVEPKRGQITDRIEKIELSISEMGKLRAGMESLRTTMSVASAGVAFDVASSSAAVSVAISDLAALENRTASVEVTALAQGQVLEFTGFATADAALGTGSLTLAFGSWDGGVFTGSGRAPATITLTNAAQGLDDLAAQLSAISGVTAQVIAKGDNSYSLAIMTETGAANALRLTSADLTQFDTTDASNEVVAARDAALSVDGVAVTRSSNKIDDLLPGLSLTLNTTTSSPAKVVALEDPDLAEAELRAFVEAINTTQAALREATARGINGAKSGPLAADPAVAALSRNLAALTTTPLEGFGDAPVYLSSLGVRTERDGSLSVDSAEFQAAMARDPALYRAVFQSLNTTSSQGVSVTVAGYGAPPAGAYTFAQTSDTTATLNGEAMIARTVDGVREFYKITGDFGGVSLRVTDPSPSSATVYFGESLIDRLRNFLDDSLAAGGDITLRTTRFEQDAREQEDLLDDLSLSETRINERYMAKFGAMEAIVTQLKSTGDYLTSMLDAWNKSNE
jgi:flagellar hook-associated protein 2